MVLISLGQSSSSKLSATEIRRALHQPVCLIPLDRSIEAEEIPVSNMKLDWMRHIGPSRLVSQVSIPATHDSGTALGRTGFTRCQVMSIGAQLAVGVRGFDIRLRLVGSDLQIYHSDESQKLDFRSVLRTYAKFLAAHPSEFLVMRVREEATAIHPVVSFDKAFERQISPYSKFFFSAKSRTELPTVSELRGKILILDNYGKLPDAVDYPNPTMSIQDDYDCSDMKRKYAEIETKFEEARKNKSDSVWNMNYTSSCNLAVDQLANARAVNKPVLTYLKGKHGNLGLVLFNFPSIDAIQRVIDSNF